MMTIENPVNGQSRVKQTRTARYLSARGWAEDPIQLYRHVETRIFHLRHSYLVMLLVVASVSACRPAVQGGDAVASRSVEAGNVNSIQTLSQGWTNKDARWFYNIPQGSRLIP